MDLRKHYKLYKSGKQWCVMALATLASVIGVATAVSANTTVTNTNEINDSTQINTISNTNSNNTSDNQQMAQSQNELTEQYNQSSNVLKNSSTSMDMPAVKSVNDSTDIDSESAISAQNNGANLTQNDDSNVDTQNNESTTSVTTQVKLAATNTNTQKKGWVNEGNHWTYYDDRGNVQSGRSYSYLPTIGKKDGSRSWYLVDYCVVQSGVQKWAGTYYDFDAKTYQRVDNNYVQSQWGDWYLFGSDGRIQTKVQKWAGTYYYFDPVTYLRVDNNYVQSQWGDWYLFGNDGRIATRVQKWVGTYDYFDPVTYLRVDNDYRQSQWGDWYLFGNDGRILSGLQKWAGSYYYFNPSTYQKETNTNFTFAGMALHADNSGVVTGQNQNASFLLSIYQAALDGWRQYGVLPSVTGAQAILESAWGRSALATEGHNLFGIKGNYNGQSIVMRTAEYGNGGYYYINDAFRRYPSNYESVVDHGRFLASNIRYHKLLWQRNYAVVTNDLHADGYATDPAYASSLNNVIRTYGLDSWDRQVF